MFFANSYLGTKKFADIKNEAKKRLSSNGYYIKIIFALMMCTVATVSVVMVGYMLLNVVDACGILDGVHGAVWIGLEFSVSFVVGFFVAIPICFGWVRFLYTVTFEEDASVLSCFHYFKNSKTYFKALGFSVPITLDLVILIAMWAVKKGAESYVIDLLADTKYYILSGVYVFLLNVALVAAVILVVFLSGWTFCSLAVFICNDDMTVPKVWKLSGKVWKGNMKKIFFYKLAYLPHTLLTVATVLIYGGIYFVPLYTIAYFDAVDELIASCDSKI